MLFYNKNDLSGLYLFLIYGHKCVINLRILYIKGYIQDFFKIVFLVLIFLCLIKYPTADMFFLHNMLERYIFINLKILESYCLWNFEAIDASSKHRKVNLNLNQQFNIL